MERLFTAQQVLESWNKSCKAIDDVDQEAKDIVREALELKIAEEKWLILRLPVAIGSTLYQNRKGNIIELNTIGIIYDILSKEWLYEVAVQCGLDWVKTVCSMECIGETVFLTKEEAEQALKQMGE